MSTQSVKDTRPIVITGVIHMYLAFSLQIPCTSGLCYNSGKGEQKMLLCFLHTLVKHLDWECTAGQKSFERSFFFWNISFSRKHMLCFSILPESIWLTACIQYIWFVYVEYTFRIYWLPAKQFESLHNDSDLVAISPEIPDAHLKTKTTLTRSNYT